MSFNKMKNNPINLALLRYLLRLVSSQSPYFKVISTIFLKKLISLKIQPEVKNTIISSCNTLFQIYVKFI